MQDTIPNFIIQLVIVGLFIIIVIQNNRIIYLENKNKEIETTLNNMHYIIDGITIRIHRIVDIMSYNSEK